VTSEAVLDVVVPGVQSCVDDAQCAPGQICRGDLTCG
jgi:hypothetical protein